MHDDLQWVEGELLALESLRQGGEDWVFPQPPRSADLPLTTTREDVARHLRAAGRRGNQDHSQPTTRPQTKLFVD